MSSINCEIGIETKISLSMKMSTQGHKYKVHVGKNFYDPTFKYVSKDIYDRYSWFLTEKMRWEICGRTERNNYNFQTNIQ